MKNMITLSHCLKFTVEMWEYILSLMEKNDYSHLIHLSIVRYISSNACILS